VPGSGTTCGAKIMKVGSPSPPLPSSTNTSMKAPLMPL